MNQDTIQIAADAFKKARTPSDFLRVWFAFPLLEGENKKTFDGYYHSFLRNFDQRMAYLYDDQLSHITQLAKNRQILEIGSGCGTESLWLAMNGASVHGVDIAPHKVQTSLARKSILERCFNKNLACTFENLSFFEMKKEQYDLIWMEQAFHHIEPREEFFKEIPHFLKPGGYLVFSESNAWNPLIQAGLFKMRGFKMVTKAKINNKNVLIGNERIIFPFILKRKLQSSGFDVTEIYYFRMFPNKSFFNKFLFLEKKMPKILKPFFSHYTLIAIKNT